MSESTQKPLRESPLQEEHLKLGAKMIGFGGWNMPVLYTSILDEHRAVRERVGLFDISHMGEFRVAGPAPEEWLNRLLTNNIARLEPGTGQYTLLLNENGGVIDDLIAYRRAENDYFLVVNAAKIEEDFDWMESHGSEGGAILSNLSPDFAALALQGPRSPLLLQQLGELPARNQIRDFPLFGVGALCARTGYTGEDGFELFFPAADAPRVWTGLLNAGESLGILPCGLGARDTLRLEACYPLNGSDLSPSRTPLEAGLGFFVDLAKPFFFGRETLVAQKAAGTRQRLVAIKTAPGTPPLRAHQEVIADENSVGELTSGVLSPTLRVGIGLGYIDSKYASPGQNLEIDIRGKRFAATVEKKPLYKRPC